MALEIGSRLGHYDVTALIGEGGMGQVYQATDTTLDRNVALKVLPDAFTADPDRLARFEREAKVLASLNHPNIGAIYGLEKSGDTRALVLELIEGPTLADRIANGPIPLDEALPIAKQIAEALEAAHEVGVIHRDLKPANIKVREDGTVKVLDFGLAKALDPKPEGDPSQSPTLTAAATQMGVIMGTAAYMSPEQAAGKPTDKRSDIWAFGCVLYEMLTGQMAFQGDDVSLTLASVMKSDVNVKRLPDDIPATVRTVLRRCLEKDASQRIRDIGDVRLAMAGAFEGTVRATSDPVDPPQPQVWQRPIPAAMAALAIATVTGLVVWTATRPDVVPADLMRFTIVPPDAASLGVSDVTRELVISRDGTQVVYTGLNPGETVTQLNLRPIDQLVGAPLRGGEGGDAPCVSPDGEWVGFLTTRTTLRKVSILGGPPVLLTESPGGGILGASWGTDNQIVFGTGRGGLFRVSAGGGEPEALTTLDPERGNERHTWPFIIPGREAVLFVASTGLPLTTGQLAVLDLDTGEVTQLGLAGVSPHYVSTGHLVYAAEDGSVRAVPFDVTSLKVTGNPVPLVEGVTVKNSGAADFSISDNGRLVYAVGASQATVPSFLVWVDRGGRASPVVDQQALYDSPRISPDGSRVAVMIDDRVNQDIWVINADRGTRTRLTSDPGADRHPLWIPDGTRITFSSNRGGGTNSLYWMAADGSGSAERLTESQSNQGATSWSSDGATLAFYDVGSTYDIYTLIPGEEPVRFQQTAFRERGPTFSPDGRWLAYSSNETGRDEVYVTPYPGPGGTTVVSTTGGRSPRWTADGRELFYRNGDEMLVVAMETEPSLQVGTPQALFAGSFVREQSNQGAHNYDVARDGQRFAMMETVGQTNAEDAAPPQITVVLNWFEELTARVPID